MPFVGGLLGGDRKSLVTPAGGLIVAAGALTKIITIQPTVEATPDYSAGDLVGGKLTLAGAARVLGGTGTIINLGILSKVDIAVATRVILFKSNPSATTFTENGALSIDAADVDKIFWSIEIAAADFADMGTPEVASKAVNIPFQCLEGSADLYACMQTDGTINLGSTSDLTFTFGIKQD